MRIAISLIKKPSGMLSWNLIHDTIMERAWGFDAELNLMVVNININIIIIII